MKNILIVLFLGLNFVVTGQMEIVLQPGPEGKDAYLRNADPDVNRADHPDMLSRSGLNSDVRAIFDFDLSEVPSNMEVRHALLSLYSYHSPSNGNHQIDSGTNESWIELVVEPWEENTVTWNNQPATSEGDRAYLPNSVQSIQNYVDIDITSMVRTRIAKPDSTFGFLLRQIEESGSSKLVFASSDNENPEIRPKLHLSLREKNESVSCVKIDNSPEVVQDAIVRSLDPDINRGSHPEFLIRAATNGGLENTVRTLLNFDYSQIPIDAEILEANLSLYAYDSPANQTHSSAFGGTNEAEILRIIEPWSEFEVNFNNQPLTTQTRKIDLPSSIAPTQNYFIDITDLLRDNIKESSYGFLLKQREEVPYGSLVFGSSDNERDFLRPQLEVCYELKTSSIELTELNFDIYPNPLSSDNLNVDAPIDGQYQILDNLGKMVHEGIVSKGLNSINTNKLTAGSYTLSIRNFDGSFIAARRLIKL